MLIAITATHVHPSALDCGGWDAVVTITDGDRSASGGVTLLPDVGGEPRSWGDSADMWCGYELGTAIGWDRGILGQIGAVAAGAIRAAGIAPAPMVAEVAQ